MGNPISRFFRGESEAKSPRQKPQLKRKLGGGIAVVRLERISSLDRLALETSRSIAAITSNVGLVETGADAVGNAGDSDAVVSGKRRKFDYKKEFPLHEAVENDSLEDVVALLERGDVDVNQRDHNGVTPFAIACCNANIRVMRVLLEGGADPFEWFYLRGPDCATTAAGAACHLASVAMLELLFQHGVDPGDTFSEMYSLDRLSHGNTLLVTAAGQENAGARDVVIFLLNHGVDVNGKNGYGLTALHAASGCGNVDVARTLLQAGAAANACGYKGDTPLHFASDGAWLDVMQLLLQSNGVANEKNLAGETPLMAIMSPCLPEARLAGVRLLVEHGADIHLKTWKNFTALYWAACSAELTQLMLELGARPSDVAEGEPCPLHLACEHAQHRAAELLLDAGADVNGVNSVDSANYMKRTPLIRAIHSRADPEDVLLTIHLLLRRGADPNWADDEGRTCLFHAVDRMRWDGGEQILRLLLANGAEANARFPLDETMLHLVGMGHFNHSDTVDAATATALLENGADVEAVDESGDAAFVRTAVANSDDSLREETMDALLDHKKNVMFCFEDDDVQ